eukprot:CAMPEP_0204336302 /NCGR_PEP_ID=MMETSP0469-20131031/19429_1 /ASSEMBLY_ACC=CAM_ASM_000384 /TAXON_ID=2969 /ORGANISM="Oxyrrhis marina" /LENGTH=53 /DNA_ID=CAMNT_0051320143 /DNA_START=14 /DNA_END=171 /DNA_ORIENTATION=+
MFLEFGVSVVNAKVLSEVLTAPTGWSNIDVVLMRVAAVVMLEMGDWCLLTEPS